MKKPKAAPKATRKANVPATDEDIAETLKVIGRNTGKNGTLIHAALAADFLAPFVPGGKLDQRDVRDGLKESANALVAGNMESTERMLYAQMVTLNAVFGRCLNHAAGNLGEYMHAAEIYMRLALKAQAQCARTAEVLGNLRAGPTIFAKQANVTSGPQQINNGAMPSTPSRAQETEKPANELLEDARHDQPQRMDPGAQAAPAGGHTAMETVEAINRPAK